MKGKRFEVLHGIRVRRNSGRSEISCLAGHFYNPAIATAKAIRAALDPVQQPSKPKSFAEMSDTEKAEMRRLYEKKGGAR